MYPRQYSGPSKIEKNTGFEIMPKKRKKEAMSRVFGAWGVWVSCSLVRVLGFRFLRSGGRGGLVFRGWGGNQVSWEYLEKAHGL